MRTEIFDHLTDEARWVRHIVFEAEQGFVDDPDEMDHDAAHIVMFEENCPIAVCRVFASPDPTVYLLGRFAVIKEKRGQQIGRKLLSAAEDYAADCGAREMRLHSQQHAMGFYGACGYEVVGEVEYEQGQPHVWMTKSLGV